MEGLGCRESCAKRMSARRKRFALRSNVTGNVDNPVRTRNENDRSDFVETGRIEWFGRELLRSGIAEEALRTVFSSCCVWISTRQLGTVSKEEYFYVLFFSPRPNGGSFTNTSRIRSTVSGGSCRSQAYSLTSFATGTNRSALSTDGRSHPTPGHRY